MPHSHSAASPGAPAWPLLHSPTSLLAAGPSCPLGGSTGEEPALGVWASAGKAVLQGLSGEHRGLSRQGAEFWVPPARPAGSLGSEMGLPVEAMVASALPEPGPGSCLFVREKWADACEHRCLHLVGEKVENFSKNPYEYWKLLHQSPTHPHLVSSTGDAGHGIMWCCEGWYHTTAPCPSWASRTGHLLHGTDAPLLWLATNLRCDPISHPPGSCYSLSTFLGVLPVSPHRSCAGVLGDGH